MNVTSVEFHLDISRSPLKRISIVRISDIFWLPLRSATIPSVIVAAGDRAVVNCAFDIVRILPSAFLRVVNYAEIGLVMLESQHS